MENQWLPPEVSFLKINVHFVSSEVALPNGNRNGVGVIIRDNMGVKVWGAMGPMQGLNESQAILWAIQASLIQTLKMGKHKTHVEMVSRDVFDTVRLQENIIIL